MPSDRDKLLNIRSMYVQWQMNALYVKHAVTYNSSVCRHSPGSIPSTATTLSSLLHKVYLPSHTSPSMVPFPLSCPSFRRSRPLFPISLPVSQLLSSCRVPSGPEVVLKWSWGDHPEVVLTPGTIVVTIHLFGLA